MTAATFVIAALIVLYVVWAFSGPTGGAIVARFVLGVLALGAASFVACASAVQAVEPERPKGTLPGYIVTYREADGTLTFTDRVREGQPEAAERIEKGSYSVLDVATISQQPRYPYVWQSFHLPCPSPCPTGLCWRRTTHAKECF